MVWDGEVVGGGLGGFCGILMVVVRMHDLFRKYVLKGEEGVKRRAFGYFVMEVSGLLAVANNADT